MMTFDITEDAFHNMYIGAESGAKIREECNLNSLDDDSVRYVFVIPKNTVTIASSFFCALFADSINKLGEKDFRAKYGFAREDSKPLKPNIIKDIDEGIYDVLQGLYERA